MIRYLHIYLLFMAGLFVTEKVAAQRGTIVTGVVTNDADSLLEGVTVILGGKYQAYTGKNGIFRLPNVPAGTYQIVYSFMGYLGSTQTVSITANTIHLKQILLRDNKLLGEIQVNSKTAGEIAVVQPVKAVVVQLKESYMQPVTLQEMVNRSSGIRIRQSGGMGSETELSLNGFQGRSIRYFKDGIPLDYLGAGFNMANIPVNMLDRVEVYKGVLPVTLGADALGGAVNFVSRAIKGNYAAVSLELASFNTRRLSFNSLFSTGKNKKLYLALNGFYNYSDNNYKASVKVTDTATRNQYTDEVVLFHNGYRGAYAEVHAGVKNVQWADEFSIAVAGYTTRREQQHPALMTDPFGAITGKQKSLIPSLKYKKRLLRQQLIIQQFLAVNTIQLNRVDTVHGIYDWYGNFTAIPARTGESRQASLSDIQLHNAISRTGLSWKKNNHLVELNIALQQVKRTGTDPYGPRFFGTDIDVLTAKAKYGKAVAGLGHTFDWLDNTITNNIMLKGYLYQSEGVDAWDGRDIHSSDAVAKKALYGGIADAVKWQLNAASFIRLSAEYAARLPEQDELIGDGVFIVPNFALQPERSWNGNLGYRWANPQWSIEANTFYRRTRNMILLVPVQAPYAQYTNFLNVRGYGLDADISGKITSALSFNANFTWQDLRLFGFKVLQDEWKNNTRLRNTPYFFANAALHYTLKKIFCRADALQLYTHYNFTREYYLETIPKRLEPSGLLGLWGSANVRSDLIIPTQHFLTGGFSYRLPVNGLQIGGEIKNITDAAIYDYYRIQKAGRSFHIKFNYIIQKNNKNEEKIH